MTDLCATKIHPEDFEKLIRSKQNVTFIDRGNNYRELDGILYHINEQWPQQIEDNAF